MRTSYAYSPRLLVLVVSLFASLTLAQPFYKTYYVGDYSGALSPGHPTSSSGNHLGATDVQGGALSDIFQLTFIEGLSYAVVNTAATTSVSLTSGTGGGSPVVTGAVLTVSGVPATVIAPGETMVVITSQSTPSTFSYQSTTENDEGWLALSLPCVNTAPAPPTLVYPVDGGEIGVDDYVVWASDDFGISCSGNTNTYAVALAYDGVSSSVVDSIIQGAGALPPTQTTLKLTQNVITPNFDGYLWTVIASNGNLTSSASIQSFNSTPQAQASPLPLLNGASVQQRMYPNIPISSSGYLYYEFEIESPGGQVLFVAASSPLSFPGAPFQGNVQIFVNARNDTHPEETRERPTINSYTWRSEEPSSILRKSVTIPRATASKYYVGVQADAGTATFALTALYFCPLRSYLSDAGSTACTACPANAEASFPGAVSAAQCVCIQGFFSDSESKCVSCPVGGVCTGEGEPLANAGFWASSSDAGAVFYKCPFPAACLGGSSSEDTCAEGYEGRLCSECVEGYYKLGGQCFKCRTSSAANFVVGIVLLLVFIAVLPELARFYRKVCSLSIVVTFIQSVAIMPYYSLQWPQYLLVFMNDFSGLNINPELSSPECVQPMKWQTQWLFTLLFPLFVLLLMLTVVGLVWAASLVMVSMGMRKPNIGATFRGMISSFVTFLLFIYVSIAIASLTFFDCTAQPDGSRTLDASADLICYTGVWNKLVIVAVFGVFLYVVAIPLGLLLVLFFNKNKLYSSEEADHWVYVILGPVYLRYTSHFYWWEVTILVRKAIIIIIGAYFTSYPAFQAALVLGLLASCLLAQVIVQPFEIHQANNLEAFSLSCQIFLYLTGLFFLSDVERTNPRLAETVFTFIVLVFFSFFAFALLGICRELYHKHKGIDQSTYQMMLAKIDELEAHVQAAHADKDIKDSHRPPPKLNPKRTMQVGEYSD